MGQHATSPKAPARARHTSDVAIPCGTARHADWVRRAIQAEVDEAPDGATCAIAVHGAELRARVEAGDLATLRAAINTFVRLADTALRTVATGNPP